MITLTPSGDILTEGLGKVGQWRQYGGYITYTIMFEEFCHAGAEDTDIKTISSIQFIIDNGFTPKKWEE